MPSKVDLWACDMYGMQTSVGGFQFNKSDF